MADRERTTTGMTLVRHIVTRARRREKMNPNGIIELTIGDGMAIADEFMEMKAQRDEALRILKMRTIPNHKAMLPHTNVEPEKKKKKSNCAANPNIDPRWAKVIQNLK